MASCVQTAASAQMADADASAIFVLNAMAEPGVLMRVLGLFAVRDLVPARVSCIRKHGMLTIRVDADMLAQADAELLLAKSREIVAVVDASLTWMPERS